MKKQYIISFLLILTFTFTQNCSKKMDFVKTRGTDFIVDGDVFYFAGTNNYYLHYKSNKMIDDVLYKAAAMDLKVIRCWGFHNGQPIDNYIMQPELGVYDESGFERLDYTIQKASQLGIRIVIPLVNNWNDFGGMNQYVQWTGGGSHDVFYTRQSIKDAFKNYINYMVNRTNTYNGIQYKNDPTIMTWELANEPRCQSDKTGNTLLNWADEISSYIKSIDSNHLIAVGDEGFYTRAGETHWIRNGNEGVDWDRLIQLPNIDYATFHMYIDHWGKSIDWGTQWIIEHIQDAHAAGKPCVLEEFGYKNQATRDSVYTIWTNTVYNYNGNGAQFWMLGGIQDDDSYYPNYDGFLISYPSSTANVFINHARQMNSKSGFTSQN